MLSKAPASVEDGYRLIKIGNMSIIVDLIAYTASVTNYTEVTETTFQPSPTMSMTSTSIPYITHCKISL